MIAIFAAQDMRHQRRADKALGNGAAWHLSLNHLLTAGAGQSRTFDLIDDVMAVRLENDSLDHFLICLTIFQLFHHVSAQFLQATAAIFAGLTGFEGLLNALEAFGKRFALTRSARRLWRVSDILCMSNLVHASKLKEHEDNDDYQ